MVVRVVNVCLRVLFFQVHSQAPSKHNFLFCGETNPLLNALVPALPSVRTIIRVVETNNCVADMHQLALWPQKGVGVLLIKLRAILVFHCCTAQA